MTTAVEPEGRDVARPLRVLVPLIKDELARAHEAGIEHYRRAGEMLREAKAELPMGEWQAWLKRHFALSISTATTYMRLARESGANRARATRASTLSAFQTPHRDAGHRPSWQEPVRRILADRVDVDRLAREQQTRDKEKQLVRQLAHQLIDIGYKVLATKLHPDKGGSAEAMARLNRVRSLLKNAV